MGRLRSGPHSFSGLWPKVVPRNRDTFLAGITADYTCLDGRDFFPTAEDGGKEVIANGGDVSGGDLDVGVKARCLSLLFRVSP
jgi:hypothetical protein